MSAPSASPPPALVRTADLLLQFCPRPLLRVLDGIVGDANGTLTVTSGPGSGTHVRVEVPLP